MTRTPCAGLLEGYSKRANCRQQRQSTRALEDEEPREGECKRCIEYHHDGESQYPIRDIS